MIKGERERRILEILGEVGITSIANLSLRLGVSSVTVRRDVARMAEQGAVRRVHGGVAALEDPGVKANADAPAEIDYLIEETDAIVLPPLTDRGAETLRRMAQRRGIPFLAESAPQVGGTYIGSDNLGAGRDLGEAAAEHLRDRTDEARVLLVSLEPLVNTRERCEGFLTGFREAFAGSIRHWRVDGRGVFKSALRASLDALQAHPDINVVFGVNDHSILAALEACDRLGLQDVSGFSVGGEGGALFDALTSDDRMVACCALFPEIVGARAVDVLERALAGQEMPSEVRTPHAIVTAETLGEHYTRGRDGWSFSPARPVEGSTSDGAEAVPRKGRRARIGFIPHYPTHDWYRSMRRSMQRRAEERGMELVVAAPQAGIAREVSALRVEIARVAASSVVSGETILINHGDLSLRLADALDPDADISVVTNSLDVLERLRGRRNLKVILTSGELHAKGRCLVGPSLGALFETMRVDRAFLSVDGMSARFGPSASDERMALAARRFVDASRATTILADHSLLGQDANHRIVTPARVDELITDSGSLPADRLALASAGIAIVVADEETTAHKKPLTPRPVSGLDDDPRPATAP